MEPALIVEPGTQAFQLLPNKAKPFVLRRDFRAAPKDAGGFFSLLVLHVTRPRRSGKSCRGQPGPH